MNYKILIVDDDPKISELLQIRLKANGYLIECAPSAKIAMQKIDVSPPDLIILDIMMPGVDGTKLCWILKEGIKYRSIPIIIISAKPQDEVQKLSHLVGADDFMTKPFESTVLIEKIKKILPQPIER